MPRKRTCSYPHNVIQPRRQSRTRLAGQRCSLCRAGGVYSVCAGDSRRYRERVLTPPDGLSEELLVSVLARHWGLEAAAISYRAVGFGSHHWEVTDVAGERWFLTADELLTRRMSVDEPPEVTVGRIRHALAAAAALRAEGHRFVVAPVPSGGGEPAVLAGDAFAVALYPFVAGQSFEWGEFCGEEHRQAVLGLVIGVRTAARCGCWSARTRPRSASCSADTTNWPHGRRRCRPGRCSPTASRIQGT